MRETILILSESALNSIELCNIPIVELLHFEMQLDYETALELDSAP